MQQRLCGGYNDCSKELIVIETEIKRAEARHKMAKFAENKIIDKLSDEIKLLKAKNRMLTCRWNNDVKKLKALEIIREKRVDVCMFLERSLFIDGLEGYNNGIKSRYSCKLHIEDYLLTQEEYDLLKEVLL